jgi:D-alanyl-D-alanine carboxypeptidase
MCVVALLVLALQPLAGAQTIADQINAILARSTVSNNTWTILIENDTGTVTYYQKNPITTKAPASNTKIFTTSAAFALLGTNHWFESRVYRNGTLANGTLTGDLNLVTEHDITWNDSTFGTGNARKGLDYIATKLKGLGLTNVQGNVQVYGVCIYNYSSTSDTRDTANQAAYNAEGATQFVAALNAQGITVSGSALGQTGFSAPGTLMYTHKSSDLTYGGKPLRLDVACIPLAKSSHNAMADELLRHIGYVMSTNDSFAAGRAQVLKFLNSSVGLTTNDMIMNDGSGLSSGNRFSAREVVSTVRYMVNNFVSWKTILPIGCVDGTISSRFCGTDGASQVHAKTGSLSISIALSGYIDNKYDNRRYYFSFISNNSSGIDQTNTRDAIDDCVVLLGARGVPISPRLWAVTNSGPNSISIAWTDEGFIRSGFRVYTSSDGITFNAPIAMTSVAHGYTESGLSPGTKRYYKVTVVNGANESPFSRVYGAQVSSNAPILIVDGNDRYQFQTTENPKATNHAFAAITGQNISGPAFATANHNAIIDGTISLTNYSAVIWLLGEESTDDRTFNPTEQSLVTAYLNNHGNLFVSGAEIGWDLDRDSGPTTADRNFYHNQLRAALNGNANDAAATYVFTPVANGIFTGNANGAFDNGTYFYNIDFPDVLTTTNGSTAAMTYVGGRGGAAAVTYDGSLGGGKVVNWGFPFESITSSGLRDAYMSDVLRFFNLLSAPTMLPTTVNGTTITLSWSASAGIKYRVQYSNDLNSGTWTDLPPDILANSTVASKSDTISAAPRFYRVILIN